MEKNDAYEMIREAKRLYDGIEAGGRAASAAISIAISGGKKLAFLVGCARVFADAAKLIEASLPEEAKEEFKFYYEVAGNICKATVVRYDAPTDTSDEQKGAGT